MLEKLKSLFLSNDTVFMALLLVVSACASFALGRSSVLQPIPSTRESAVTLVAAPSAVLEVENEIEEVVVASKNGTKYHLPTCPGGKQITAANKISFASIAAAQAAGYEPAANCAF